MGELKMKRGVPASPGEETGKIEKALESKNIQFARQVFETAIKQNHISRETVTAAALSLAVESMPESFKTMKNSIESKAKGTVTLALRPFVPNVYELEGISLDQNLIVASYKRIGGDSGITIKIDPKSSAVTYELSFKF